MKVSRASVCVLCSTAVLVQISYVIDALCMELKYGIINNNADLLFGDAFHVRVISKFCVEYSYLLWPCCLMYENYPQIGLCFFIV